MRGRPVLLGACALVAASCAPESTAPPPAPRATAPVPGKHSSLLLVSLDTFRADAAGTGGNPSARTPHLDRLARTGVEFATGLAPVPLTLPSHASLLTGLEPPAHGVRDNGTFRLPEGIPTVADALRERGFATAAFIAAFPLDERFGLANGFDVYDDDVGERGERGVLVMDQRDGKRVTDAALPWLAAPADRRRFAFVHLFDAHSPWDAPAPVRAAVGGAPYLADASRADHWLGRAVDAARAAGDFWVVVLGDHGESLGDHGESTHGLFLYGATMRVPAVIWPAPPGERPGLRRGAMRLVDFPATAFALLGLDPAEAPGDGAPALAGPAGPAYMETWYPLYHYGWSVLRAVQEGDWKYVEAPEPELYDLAADPGESHNVAAEHPGRARDLAERVTEQAARRVESSGVELDESARLALESLGYVSGGEPDAPEEVAPADRPDPKRMVGVQAALERAEAMLAAGNADGALAALRPALSRDPRNKTVHQIAGMAQAAAGRDAQAVDSFLRCLELPPHRNDRIPRFELASAYIRLGEPAKGAEQLEIILAEYPGDAASWYNLGVARDRQGRGAEAREAWERALRADSAYAPARDALKR